MYNNMYNTKLVNDLSKRKVFKKHIYHNNNEEGFTWDDYDTMHYYTNENEDEWFLPKPKKEDKACQALIPQLKSIPAPLKPETKILLRWSTYNNTKTTQTDNPTTCNETTQTFPKFYMPDTRSSYNIQPFKTYLGF